MYFLFLNYVIKFVLSSAHNVSLQDTLNAFDEFIKKDHSISDSTIVVVMSHGRAAVHGTEILTSSNDWISSEYIVDHFNSSSCPSLKGKPKIFLFQCCRGDKEDQGLLPTRHHEIKTMRESMTNRQRGWLRMEVTRSI